MRQWRKAHPENAEQNRRSAHASRERRLEEVRAYDRARGYRVYDPEKVRARKAASLIPRKECEVEDCSALGERHHDDYSKPRDVRFLCRKHHGEIHRKLVIA
jgi:hypothetical protein